MVVSSRSVLYIAGSNDCVFLLSIFNPFDKCFKSVLILAYISCPIDCILDKKKSTNRIFAICRLMFYLLFVALKEMLLNNIFRQLLKIPRLG